MYIDRLLSHIDEIVEKSILLDTAVSNRYKANKKRTSQFMHYLYSIVEYNGNPFLAKITVEEYNQVLDVFRKYGVKQPYGV